MSQDAKTSPAASPDSTDLHPIGNIFGLPWLWRQCWAAGLMLILVWIVAAIMGQFNGSTIMVSSWAGCFGFILGMTSQMWIQQRWR